MMVYEHVNRAAPGSTGHVMLAAAASGLVIKGIRDVDRLLVVISSHQPATDVDTQMLFRRMCTRWPVCGCAFVLCIATICTERRRGEQIKLGGCVRASVGICPTLLSL